MGKPLVKKINFGEYQIIARYYGDGKLDVDILDELGDIIEGVYIVSDNDNDDDNYKFNLN